MVKSWWSALAVLAAIGLSIGATVGIMTLSGVPMNMLTVAMPGLLLILGVASAVHIVHRFQELAINIDKKTAAMLTMQELRRPCIEATLTTAVGFSSLTAASMPAVRQLGIFTAIGLALGLAANLYLVPWALAFPWNRIRCHGASLSLLALKIGRFGYHRYRWIHGSAGILIILTAIVASHYQVEANTLKFLPDDDHIVQDSKFVSEHLTGVYSLELDIQVARGIEAPWQWLEHISRQIEQNPAVARVYGPTDLLKKINAISEENHQAYRLPESRAAIDLSIVSMEGMVAQEWRRICKNNEHRLRVSILISAMSSEVYRSVFDDIAQVVATRPPGISITTTGIIALVIQAEKELIRTQLKTFALAAAIICAMLLAVLRTRQLVLAAIPVNLLPPFLAFAAMVAVGIKINAGTVIVASIAMGIAVDDTVHFCRRLNWVRTTTSTTQLEPALARALEIAGAPIIATSVVISAGFAALLFAPFRPLMYFGGLTVVAVILALICDLIWLPALLRILQPSQQ